MKKKLDHIQLMPMVLHKNPPNSMKNWISHANKIKDAPTLVTMPDSTEIPISAIDSRTRPSRVLAFDTM